MVQVVFEVNNTSDASIVGQAIPSYGPPVAAQYVKKVECFCFARQEVKAGERRQMPVRFVVDPALPGGVSTITLSYTFFELPGSRGG
jgi:cytochrome c oxidase assembly protein subunit 11